MVTDEQIDAALDAAEQRFEVVCVQESPFHPVYLVRDSLTGRVREATNDYDDAESVALWLNTGHTYRGGEPLAVF